MVFLAWDLPEVFAYVMSFLDLGGRFLARRVCTAWADAVDDAASSLFSEVVLPGDADEATLAAILRSPCLRDVVTGARLAAGRLFLHVFPCDHPRDVFCPPLSPVS